MKSLGGLKVVFMGTPAFSVPSLKALIESGCEIAGVVTQPDRPKGRGRKMASSPVKELALAKDLPLYQPRRVREEDFVAGLRDLAPDFIAVVAFGQILPGAVLDIPRLGCINVHASLLPAYRGAAPISWAVARGESVTGVTTMLMDEGLDTGDMLLKREVPIGPEDDAESLYGTLSEEGALLLVETLHGMREGSITPTSQDDSAASLAPILKKEDGIIDWAGSSQEIVNLVRGMLPWPVAFTTLRGRTLKVYRAEAGGSKGEPGAVLSTEGWRMEVAAGSGSVSILELQMEGKRRMDSKEFLRGFTIKKGEVLGS